MGVGGLDTDIMKMWRHSVLKNENLDSLVELLIFAFGQRVPLLQIFFLTLYRVSPLLFLVSHEKEMSFIQSGY